MEKKSYRWKPSQLELAFLLISLYIGFLVALLLNNIKTIDLQEDEPFLIGEATAYGISIGKRVSLTYFTLIVGLISTSVSYSLLLKNVYYFQKFKDIRFTILPGLLIIFGFINLPAPFDSSTFCFLNLIFLSECFIVYFKDENLSFSTINKKAIFWLSALSLSIIISNWILLTLIILCLLVLTLRLKNQTITTLILLTVTILPVIALISVELTLILNQREIFLKSYLFIGVPLLMSSVFLIYKAKIYLLSSEKQLYTVVVPIVLIALSGSAAYGPIQTFNHELFEMANELNPLMMTLVHGKIPVFDYISSHLFSDFASPFLYTLLNGYNGSQDPILYKWLPSIVSLLITYYFLKSIVGNRILIVLIIVVLPFLNFYIPQAFGFALLPILLLHRYFQTLKVSFLWLSFFGLLFVSLWRLDLAAALVPSYLIVGIICYVHDKKTRRSIVKITLVAGFLGVIIIGFLTKARPDLISELLHYFGANQAHGIHVLSNFESNLFFVDYFLLPFCVSIVLLLLLFNSRKWQADTFYFPMLLIIGFYFFNLQRGLVRHTFVEMNETAILSFGWLILFIFIYRFLYFRKELVLFLSLIVIGYTASIHTSNGWKSNIDSPKKFSLAKLPTLGNEKINRTIPPEWLEYSELLDFLNQHLKPNETFLDFSNTPMLYYYSQKEVPSIFCQYLQNTVDAYLQEQNINKIKKMNIPFVVFNHVPRTFFDQSDGIPNEVRYYRMTANIYKNYKPFKTIGGYAIWVKKNSTFEPELDLSQETEKWFLGHIPLQWREEKQQESSFQPIHNQPFSERSRALTKNTFTTYKSNENDFLLVTIVTTDVGNHILRGKVANNEMIEWHFATKKGQNLYVFPIGCSIIANLHPKIDWTCDLSQNEYIERISNLELFSSR